MSYVIVKDDNTFEVINEEINTDRLLAALGDVPPELLKTPDAPELVYWVNDNFIADAEAGKVARNQLATTATIGLGVYPTPLAGTVVFTSLRTDEDGGYEAGDLEPEYLTLLVNFLGDVRHVLYGEGELSEHARELMGDDVKDEIKKAGQFALENPFQGGLVTTMDPLEFLRAIGVPEGELEVLGKTLGINPKGVSAESRDDS